MSTIPKIEWDQMPEPMRKQLNISKEEFEQIYRQQLEREANTPPVGSVAPDFDLQVLGDGGTLSGERLRLSSMRGRPVALVFGSYT